jgi:hypothetical protein
MRTTALMFHESFLLSRSLRDRTETTQSRAKGMVAPLIRFHDHFEAAGPHGSLAFSVTHGGNVSNEPLNALAVRAKGVRHFGLVRTNPVR